MLLVNSNIKYDGHEVMLMMEHDALINLTLKLC